MRINRPLVHPDRRRRLAALLFVTGLVLMSCSGSDPDAAVPPSYTSPCDVVAVEHIESGFDATPSVVSSTDAECRYVVGDDLLRVTLLSEHDSTDAVQRAYGTVGNPLEPAEGAPEGVFVPAPTNEVVVTSPAASFVMTYSRPGADVRSSLLVTATSWVTAQQG